MKKLVLFLIAISIAIPLQAGDVSMKVYLKTKETAQLKTYIDGLASGYMWANGTLTNRKQPLLYCQPGNLSLGIKNYIDIIDREFQDNKKGYSLDDNVELILLIGLQKTFPCGSP